MIYDSHAISLELNAARTEGRKVEKTFKSTYDRLIQVTADPKSALNCDNCTKKTTENSEQLAGLSQKQNLYENLNLITLEKVLLHSNTLVLNTIKKKKSH